MTQHAAKVFAIMTLASLVGLFIAHVVVVSTHALVHQPYYRIDTKGLRLSVYPTSQQMVVRKAPRVR